MGFVILSMGFVILSMGFVILRGAKDLHSAQREILRSPQDDSLMNLSIYFCYIYDYIQVFR